MEKILTDEITMAFRKFIDEKLDWQIEPDHTEAFTKSLLLGIGEVLGKNRSTEDKFRFKIGEVAFGISYQSGAEGNFGIEITVGEIDDAVDFTETNLLKRIAKNMEKFYGLEPVAEGPGQTLVMKFFEYLCTFGRENEDVVVDIENYLTLVSNDKGQIKFIAGSEMKQKLKSDLTAEEANA